MSEVFTPAVPNLPLPKQEYSQLYLNQLTNVLRLYFNLLNNNVSTNTQDISSLTVMSWIGNGGGIYSG